jgi:hypothetical protein
VPDILPRRRLLAASAAALPALLAVSGCRSSDVFAGPDPLAGPSSPAPDVLTLQAVIAAEQAMIRLYQGAIGTGTQAAVQEHGLDGLLAQHQSHLTQLRSRLILPAPSASPSAAAPGSSSAGASAPAQVTVAQLRSAERASAASLLRKLAAVPPDLAQLFASIAASDATHAMVLG